MGNSWRFGGKVNSAPTIVGNTVTIQKNPCNQPVGIDPKHSDLGIILYPNPAKKYLIVESQGINENILEQIIIYNTNGQVMIRSEVVGEKVYLDLFNFKKGIYLMKAITKTESSTFKFIKQ